MNTVLSGKAATNHTHDLSNITASCEYEMTMFDVTSTETETKGLDEMISLDGTPWRFYIKPLMGIESNNKIIGSNVKSNNETRLAAAESNITSLSNGKANSSHTHTLSDITNYSAPDLTPYATTSAMNTALSGKAATSHTHELDDVILTYEEEEETNGETSTITKTKTLSEVLDEKAEATHTHSGYASSSHTHTLSEITNYTAPDLSNCAQLNANNNTFTGKIQTNNLGVENRMDVYQGVINIFNCNAIDTWNSSASSLDSNLKVAILSLVYPVGSIYMNK